VHRRMEAIIITESGREFVALRKDGPVRAAGRPAIYHAVTPSCRIALCGTEPGASSGWAGVPSDRVTCAACQRKLRKLEGATTVIPSVTQASQRIA
jgi:hypothetical protein